MKENRFKYFVYALIILIVVAGTILVNILPNSSFSQKTNVIVLVITILLDILSLAYFIVQDVILNKRTIARYGSLSLFETLDRESISKIVIDDLQEKPENHVIYIDCEGLPRIELENIKQRIYDNITNYKKTETDRKKFLIANVFIPAAFDMQKFNESVFYNRTKSYKLNVYIFDSYTANSFYIDRIGERLNNRYEDNNYNIARNTYIVYLRDRSIHTGGNTETSIKSEDLKELLIKYAKIEKKELWNSDLHTSNIGSTQKVPEIKNIFVVEKLMKEPLNIKLIKTNPEFIYALYYNETGDYKSALRMLSEANKRNCLDKSNPYIIYLLADTVHLLNFYQISTILCMDLLNKTCGDLKVEVLKKYAHVLKHIGFFTCCELIETPYADIAANKILDAVFDAENLPDEKFKLSVDVNKADVNKDDVNKYVNRKKAINTYFSFLTAALCAGSSGLKTTTRIYGRENFIEHISDSTELFSDSVAPEDVMYYSAFLSYKNPLRALRHIDDVVEYFENINHRRKYNAYYVKAEILRKLGNYNEAYRFYIKSSGMAEDHADVNLLDQSYFSLKALEKLNLVNGMMSFQVKSYRDSLFDSDGMRKDYKECISMIEEIFKGAAKIGEIRPELRFNKTLTEYIDNSELNPDELKKLLAENVFIIL